MSTMSIRGCANSFGGLGTCHLASGHDGPCEVPCGCRFGDVVGAVGQARLCPRHRRQYGGDEVGSIVVPAPEASDDQRDIAAVCDELKAMLLEKNRAYGSSFANPMGIFARGLSPEAQVRVRIDDKLARLAKGDPGFGGEDTVFDLAGYLILLRVLQRREGTS